MDEVTIRRADAADVDELVRLRLAFLADVRGAGPAATDAAFADATRAWTVDATTTGRAVSWLAAIDGTAVGVTTVAIHDVPPLPEDDRDRDGYLLNVYVVPDARRRGIARALLHVAEAAAPELGLRRLTLFATAEGAPLYGAEGFRSDPRWMAKPVG